MTVERNSDPRRDRPLQHAEVAAIVIRRDQKLNSWSVESEDQTGSRILLEDHLALRRVSQAIGQTPNRRRSKLSGCQACESRQWREPRRPGVRQHDPEPSLATDQPSSPSGLLSVPGG